MHSRSILSTYHAHASFFSWVQMEASRAAVAAGDFSIAALILGWIRLVGIQQGHFGHELRHVPGVKN